MDEGGGFKVRAIREPRAEGLSPGDAVVSWYCIVLPVALGLGWVLL